MSELSCIRIEIPIDITDYTISEILQRVAQTFEADNLGFLEAMGSQGVSDEDGEQLARIDLAYDEEIVLERAAPKLLEALETLCFSETVDRRDYEAAEAEIAKAKGE